MAVALKFSNFGVANLQYGKFAHIVSDALSYTPPTRLDGTTRWWFTLSYGKEGCEETDSEHFIWVMRTELVQALEEMKWVKSFV